MTRYNKNRPQVTPYTTKKYLAELRMEENAKDAIILKEVDEAVKKLKKDR
jgi:hypothetical protein